MKYSVKTWCGLVAGLLLLAAEMASAGVRSSQFPPPGVRDQIIQNRGNIGVTIQNYGYIGGYSWAGLPSGRWPANSDRDYLAEMRFWAGGITESGDTLVANTDEDFTPMTNWSAAARPTDILLSTDPARYPYDAADTVGLGIGFPAYGWRVWNVAERDWEYNQVYHMLSSSYYQGGPLGVQESICRFSDDNLGAPVMGLEITQTVRQWNYTEIKDFIIFTLEITNAGTTNYHDFAFGLYCDFDIGGLDPASGENGRLGDLVAVDPAMGLAWTYDEDGYDPGWGPGVEAGVMGTVILSTPNDVGMTSFNTGQWEFLPTTDKERFELIDNTEIDASLPPTDQYYVQGIRGLNLLAGETIKIDFALVAASDSVILKDVAQRAKTLYANHMIASRPPDDAQVRATAGNHKVTLRWDDTSEKSVDPASGQRDFKGYKIFRSTDQGLTWGKLENHSDGSVGPEYIPLKLYLTDDFGRIPHTFTDVNLVNGKEYWYAIVGFDTLGQQADYSSQRPETAPNIIRVFPCSEPLGYVSPQGTVAHTYTGSWQPANDSVIVYVVDNNAVTGDEYAVTFAEDCYAATWNLINVATGDTVLANQDQFEGDPGTYPIADGLQIMVRNPRVPDTTYQSGFAVSEQTTLEPLFIEQFASTYGCNAGFRNDIEIRFTEAGSTAYDWFTDNSIQVPFEVWNVTTDSQVGCWIADFSTDGEWTMAEEDYIILTAYDYDNGAFHPEMLNDYLTWIMAFSSAGVATTGDVYRIDGPRLMSPDDQFAFSSHKIVGAQVSHDMDKIKVVPNPYMGRASWETTVGSSKVQFVNLPNRCSIRIFTLAGELINTLEHTNETGTEDWNLLSEAGRGISSGVYLFNVQSEYGNYTGKFAVIK